jgi:hypothetical protein
MLVGDGDADPFTAQVEREKAAARLAHRLLFKGLVIVFLF